MKAGIDLEKIILNKIIKENCTIVYDFSVSDGLSKYFSGKPFTIEYPEDITSVPDSIAAIPFVCNVLPIIWLTDSELILEEIDKSFFECIPEVKKGYETMFPETFFRGKIRYECIVENHFVSPKQSGMLFSGGVDSVNTLVSHLEENPYLFGIWGSDIKFNHDKEWNNMYQNLMIVADKFNLKLYTIKSTFREFDLEYVLNESFFMQLKDQWWHGVKHSLALLSHIAPIAYLTKTSVLYIASTNCPEDEPVRCASNPKTDNYVKFSDCNVVHDGYEFNRQQKIANIITFSEAKHSSIPLLVCWESAQGTNCCKCEKCYRTILGIIAEGGDPTNYGFSRAKDTIKIFRDNFIASSALDSRATSDFWIHIQNRLCENKKVINNSYYWKYIRWLIKADFSHPETIKPSLRLRVGEKLSAFGFYRFLHRVKTAILK